MRLWPVGLSFIVFGVHIGGWSVVTLDAKDRLGGSELALAFASTLALLVASFVTPVAGAVAERRGARGALVWSLAAWAAVQCLAAGLAISMGGFLPAALGIVLAGTFAGAVDVVMNVSATSGLADRPGALVRFHGLFNLGAAAGGVGAGVILAFGGHWSLVWLLGGVGAAVAAVGVATTPIPAGVAGAHVPLAEGFRLLRSEGLLPVGLAFALGAAAEGGMALWGVQYLRQELDSGVLVGAGAAVGGFLIGGAARILLGNAAGNLGTSKGAMVGASLGVVGMAGLALAPNALVGTAAFVAASAGMAVCWPLLMARMAGGRARPGAVVGAASAIGYLGVVAGPASVGVAADRFGLRVGVWLLAVYAALVVALVARVGWRAARRAPVPAG